MALLQLDQDGWPFRGLLALLTSNFFHPKWSEWQGGRAARSARFVVRHLQVPSGRDALIEQTQRCAEQEPDAKLSPLPSTGAASAVTNSPLPSTGEGSGVRGSAEHDNAATSANDDQPGRQSRGIKHARRALPLFQRLAAALARLPKQATPGEWGQALARLASETGLLSSIEAVHRPILNAGPSTPPSTQAPNDRDALDCLLRALSAVQQSTHTAAEGAAPIDRADLLELVRDILAHDQLPGARDETGRVRVLSAANARALEIPYLFMAGLSEKAFPPAARDEDLYSEAEYQRLAEAGLPLVLRAERSQQEMLLFYEVVTRATRRLYLSYAGLDDRGNPLLPSPYLAEIERACGPGVIVRHETSDLSPIPQADEPFSPAEERVLAVSQALAGKPDLLAGLCQSPQTRELADNILAGLTATRERGPGHDFGPYEGMVSSEAAAARLAERFGPQRVWSPSHLEQYGACPHQFFLDRVLGLEPLEELTLATDFLTRGARLHDALAQLHRRHNERGGGSPRWEGDAVLEMATLASEVLSDVLRPSPADAPLTVALKDIDRQLLAGWLDRYLGQFAEYLTLWTELDEPLAAAHFEVSFGLEPAAADPLSTLAPLVLVHRGQKLLLSGRIDRVDLGQVAGRSVFNIVDYKSGKSSRHTKRAIDEGEALQLSIYCLAAQELLLVDRKAVPWCIGYWFVAAGGFPKNQAATLYEAPSGEVRPTPRWEALRRNVTARVFALVEGIRRGEFPMINSDVHCTSHCDFHTVCRVNQARSLEKKWSPPATSAT